jgi:hypothetical protein
MMRIVGPRLTLVLLGELVDTPARNCLPSWSSALLPPLPRRGRHLLLGLWPGVMLATCPALVRSQAMARSGVRSQGI